MRIRNALVTGVAAALAAAASAAPAGAAPGRPDPRFGGDGRATTFAAGAVAFGIAIDDEGRIVVAGYTLTDNGTDVAVARFRPGGALDPDFGDGTGRVTIDLSGFEYGFDLAIQPNGRIVIAGERVTDSSDDMLVIRLQANGVLDDSFSDDGRVLVDFDRPFQAATAVVIDADGRIVVGGYASGGSTSRWALARLLPDGTLDDAFGGDGRTATNLSPGAEQIHDLEIQTDGRVVAAGEAEVRGTSRFAIARYTVGGRPDGTFSGNGRELTDVSRGPDVAYAVALVPDGGIVAAGLADDEGRASWGVVRYRQQGELVDGFGRDGRRVIDLGPAFEFAQSALVRANGKIVLAGRGHRPEHGDDMLVIRLRDDGELDRTYAGDGRAYIDFDGEDDTARAVVVDDDGRVLVAGETRKDGVLRFGVARLRSG